VSGGSLSYTYGQADRLTAAISGTTLATYSYDGDGRRQSKTAGGVTTGFTWDQSGSLPLLLRAGTSSGTAGYIDGPDWLRG
jgi:YD repeat-containing protein